MRDNSWGKVKNKIVQNLNEKDKRNYKFQFGVKIYYIH